MSTKLAKRIESSTNVRHAAKTAAVIDIGTSSIRMAIAEIDEDGQIKPLENLSQAVSLGRDTFTKGAIESSTIEDCVRVLKSYRQLLDEYHITDADDIHVVATSSVREASNRLTFLKRIYVATGLRVDPIDEAETNRVMFLGVQPLLASRPDLAESQAVILEVGGGSTDVLVMHQGDVRFAYSYRLGSLRLRKSLEGFRASAAKTRKIMESQIDRTVEQICEQVPRDESSVMVALGGDVRFAASHLEPGWERRGLGRIKVSELRRFASEVLKLTVDELVQKYHLSFPDAETVGPALLTYVQLARALKLKHILVCDVNLRDGLLKEMAVQEAWTEGFRNQIVRSAIDMGRRFNFHEGHALHVANLCVTLFHELEPEHQMEERYELLMYIAALLHDIGYIVSPRSHHKHAMYLIMNGELFGLSQKDLLQVALVARYHRRASPKPIHEGYDSLDWESRINVAKMAAILRLADALDRSNSQWVKEFKCSREKGQLVISVPGVSDQSLEQLALKQKGSLFEDVFGMKVILRSGK